MSTYTRLTQVFERSMEIPFDDSSRIILMSDCHRSDGSWADNFRGNKNIYYCALEHYYKNGFTYIELGDGDELWANRSLSTTTTVYSDIFELLGKFHKENRFYMLFGNHDIVKKNSSYMRNVMNRFGYEKRGYLESLFQGLKVHEGLILKHSETGDKIFLVHGHQGDLLNDYMWPLGRFLVRHVWRRLEMMGFKDPTSAAKNYWKKSMVENRIFNWAEDNNMITIIGHTHRPAMPEPGGQKYFNDGCCVHPNSITGIEINCGAISLVKWEVKTREDGTMYIGKKSLSGPRKLGAYFS